MPLFDKAAAKGGFEGGRAHRARGDPREPALHLPPREGAGAGQAGRHLSRRRRRPRVAPLVLPLGHAAGSGAARAGEQGRAVGAGDAREADAPHAGGSARRGARHALRRAVAAAAGHRQGPPGSELLPELRRQPRRRDAPRDRALLQQPRARGSQRARSLSRQLHLRERTAGAPLRLPGRGGRRVPPRRVPGRHPPRPARTGQRAGPDVARQPHVAGAARQVGDGSADRHAAAAAAAQRPDARRDGRREGRQDADHARADGDAPGESELHVVPPLHGSDRPGARQLRRHREVARARERHAARHPRRLLRRHAGDQAGGADRGAAASARCRWCGRSPRT